MLTFNGSGSLALALGRGLFVKLTGAQLGQKTSLFDGALEAADSNFERLIPGLLIGSARKFFRIDCGKPTSILQKTFLHQVLKQGNRMNDTVVDG